MHHARPAFDQRSKRDLERSAQRHSDCWTRAESGLSGGERAFGFRSSGNFLFEACDSVDCGFQPTKVGVEVSEDEVRGEHV